MYSPVLEKPEDKALQGNHGVNAACTLMVLRLTFRGDWHTLLRPWTRGDHQMCRQGRQEHAPWPLLFQAAPPLRWGAEFLPGLRTHSPLSHRTPRCC